MALLDRLLAGVRGIVRRRPDADLDLELDDYLRRAVEQKIATGMSPEPNEATPNGVSRCHLRCRTHGAFLFVDSGRANAAAPGQPMHFMSAPESHESNAGLDRVVGGG